MSDIGATAPISALTHAFSIGLDRGHQTDDFGPRIIVRRADIDEERDHLRQEMNRIGQVIEQL